MKRLKQILVLFCLVCLSHSLYGQKDTIKTEMKFDFGITRDKDINLWPLLKYYRQGKQLDLQIVSPFFRKQFDTLSLSTKSHLFPAYWNYKSPQLTDKRILSLYYPSLFRVRKDSLYGVNSYRFVELAPQINMLEFTKSKDGLFVQNNLFFFLWFKNDQINHRSHFIFFPVYWNFNSPESKTNLLFPLYLNTKNYWYGDTSVFSTIFPLYWSYRNSTSNIKVFTPLVWRTKSTNYQTFTFAPFYSSGKSKDTQQKHLMIASLYWQFDYADSRNRAFLPIYYHHEDYYRNDTSKLNLLFPLYWSFKNKEKNNKIIAPPLIWSFKNQRYRSFTVLPLYSRGMSADSSSKYRMLASLYWKIENYDSKNHLFFPLFFHRKHYLSYDTTRFATIFPVYWSYKSDRKNNHVVFPVLWSIKNDRYHSFSMLPLVFRKKSVDSSTKRLMLGSVYWQYKSPARKGNAFVPLYWKNTHYYADDTTRFSMFFPLYFSYADKNNKKSVFFPISWNLRNSYYKSFTFVPLFSTGKSLVSDNKHFMLASVYWKFDTDKGKDRLIVPVYYKNVRYRRADTTSFATVFPLYWSYRDGETNTRIGFPLSWSFHNLWYNSYTFVPFYSKGKSSDSNNSHFMLASLYWRFKTDRSENTLFLPLYFHQQRFNAYDTTSFTTIFPFYWSFGDRLTHQKIFFPFIWRSKGIYYQSFTFFPLFSTGKSVEGPEKHLVLTPLFWHIVSSEATTNVLFPLYWSRKKSYEGETEKSSVFFPFYWSYKDNEVNNKIFFPLVWSFKDKKDKSFTLLPFYSHGNWFGNKKYTAITPLYWHLENEDEKFNLLFPLFDSYSNRYGDKNTNVLFFLWRHKKTPESATTHFLWPIGEAGKDSNSSYFRLAPIIWYKNSPELKHFSFQPFYYTSTTNEFKTHHLLWQLYVSTNYFGYKKSHSFLWKVFFKDTYENHDFETRLLYLVYANVKKDGVVEKSLFPLYHKREDASGNKSFSMFFYFYGRFQRKLETGNDFYREDKIFWFIRLRSNYGQLKREGKI